MTLNTRTRDSWAIRACIAVTATAGLLVPTIPANAQTTEVLLTPTSATMAELVAAVGNSGGRVLETWEVADTLLVELPAGVAIAGSAVVPNVGLRLNSLPSGVSAAGSTVSSTYRETIRAGAATGKGVTVALVDTGVAALPELPVVEHVNVSGGEAGDGYGHGTFLAGLIAGTGEFPGVAPGASIVDVQVADEDGNTSLAQVLKGLQAVADRPSVKVLNISLSSGSPLPPQFDPLAVGLNKLWKRGVTVITAAGNDGPDKRTVSSPGNDPVLITVGSTDEHGTASVADDTVAEFSSRGTRFLGPKPDFVAPGVSLVSTRAPGSIAVNENPNSLIGDSYMKGSGTSMSAAVAAGAAAAVLAVNPRLTPAKVKTLLAETADRTPAVRRATGGGAGSLDLGAALELAASKLNADPGTSEEAVEDEWGPEDSEEAKWMEFSEAWEAGDYAAVKAAWAKLSWRTKQWASRAYSMTVAMRALGLPDSQFEARQWSARQWSFDEWLARQWSARQWSELDWSYQEWLARQWSARQWSARQWSARQWSADEWLSSAWSARQWSDSDWAARQWSARQWSARQWSARQWSDYVWEARQWSARQWSARQWSMIG